MQIKRLTTKHLLSFVVLLIFVFLAAGSDESSSVDNTPRDPNAWKTKNNKSMAYIMMEDFVEGRLKCPSTAKFPGVFSGKLDHVTVLGNQTYRIVSYVDAQNGFGATTRTYFTGEIKQVSDDRWRLVLLNF